MTAQDRDPVLRRKLAPRSPPLPEAVPPGPAPTLARAFGRAISDAAPLVAEEVAISHGSATLPELLDALETDAFVILLSTATGGPALALVDQEGFATVIEAMTIGRLGPRRPVARRPTPTDAALLAEVIDATLRGLGEGDPLSAVTCTRPVPDHRLLPVLLDDVDYDLVTLTAELISGDIVRAIRLMLALPHHAALPAAPPAGAESAVQDWNDALEDAVMRAPAVLRAELGRVTLPLAEVLRLGIGSALTMPLSNLEEVRLIGLDGSCPAIGRLGQTRGMRAVRLTGWPGGLPAAMTDASPPGRAFAEAEPEGAFPGMALGLPAGGFAEQAEFGE
ncbi:MAG: FliM/FliN family flagellar motor switch protein [Pararhodobacter sp.]